LGSDIFTGKQKIGRASVNAEPVSRPPAVPKMMARCEHQARDGSIDFFPGLA
jgi:hypothetical protein